MLQSVEQTPAPRQMKPAEVIGRWGCNEYPACWLTSLRRSSSAGTRAASGGLARTAEFRWWGDSVLLHREYRKKARRLDGDTLQSALRFMRCQAMQASIYAGGNHVTEARGRE